MIPSQSPLFYGCATALVTPFRGGEVDREAFVRLLRFQLDPSAEDRPAALVVCGTTGESPTLTDAEKEWLISVAVAESLACPSPVPVIAGTGSNNTRRAVELCEARGLRYRVGNILSSDQFYNDSGVESTLAWAKMGVLGVEMEASALYCNAARAGKRALCLCTVSDSFVYPEENATAEERQTSFTDMMELALELAIQ